MNYINTDIPIKQMKTNVKQIYGGRAAEYC